MAVSLGERFKDDLRLTRAYARYRSFRGSLEAAKWYKSGKTNRTPPAVKIRALRQCRRDWNLSTLVETGTYRGDTIAALIREFDQIYSVELDTKNYTRACRRFARDPHVHLLHGDSATLLPRILPRLPEPCLFWLDAHYCGPDTARSSEESPIWTELSAILHSRSQADVIMIDDADYFDGAGEYPHIDEIYQALRRARPTWSMTIEDDVVCIASPDARDRN